MELLAVPTGHLNELEDEAIYVLREVAAQFERLQFFSPRERQYCPCPSGDESFYPAQPPFSMQHIDTGHNFQETLEFRDALGAENRVTPVCEIC